MPALDGMAAYNEPPKPPKVVEAEGKELVARATQAIERGEVARVEADLRKAIELLVDAFLLDRTGNSSAFATAHRVGAFVSKSFGCRLKSDDGQHWKSGCGIQALHSRFGSSIGGTTHGCCSICSADDLECDHVPGQTYDGEQCVRIIHKVDLKEVSVVVFPEDPRCYRLELSRTVEEIEEMSGQIAPSDAVPMCSHCEICPGTPTAEDLDQRLWEQSASGS